MPTTRTATPAIPGARLPRPRAGAPATVLFLAALAFSAAAAPMIETASAQAPATAPGPSKGPDGRPAPPPEAAGRAGGLATSDDVGGRGSGDPKGRLPTAPRRAD